jgi:hypothetical protein
MPKQRYVSRKVSAPLANFFPFSTSYDRQSSLQSTSEDFLLLSGSLPTILACACAYLSQMATNLLWVFSTVLHAQNASLEDSRLLARPAYRRGVRGISSTQTASY